MPRPFIAKCEAGHLVEVDWETVVLFCGGRQTAWELDELLPPSNTKLLPSEECPECQ